MSTDPRSALPAVRCMLDSFHPSRLAPVENDIRDRTTADYRDWFDRLVADLRERGVQQPIIAYRDGERVRTVDGETRRLAALMAGLESVPVLIYPEKPADLKLASL